MISIIVATSLNNVIGKNNDLPWYLPDDLKHFSKITKGHTVIMGRKTYESIFKRLGKPLPERKNIIITRNKDFSAPNCFVFNDTQALLKEFSKDEEVFIIGGAEIYKSFLPFTDKIYLTQINTTCDGDVFFPEIKQGEWKEISNENNPVDEKHKYDFSFITLVKN